MLSLRLVVRATVLTGLLVSKEISPCAPSELTTDQWGIAGTAGARRVGVRLAAASATAAGAARSILEDAVLDQFSVKAAIVGVIDFLGHQAVEHGADFRAGFVNLDDDLARVGGRDVAGEDQARAQGSQSEEGTARNKTEGRT